LLALGTQLEIPTMTDDKIAAAETRIEQLEKEVAALKERVDIIAFNLKGQFQQPLQPAPSSHPKG
jgi:hypothetical protein